MYVIGKKKEGERRYLQYIHNPLLPPPFSLFFLPFTLSLLPTYTFTPNSSSLKLKFSIIHFDNYFDKNFNQFVKYSRYPHFENYNQILKNELNKFEAFDFSVTTLSSENRSFLKYVNDYIATITNHGTKIKSENVVAKLINFLTRKDQNDLLFKEITPAFLRAFRHYMETEKYPKRLSQNTANHYLKMLSTFIEKASLDSDTDRYSYIKNPFDSITYSSKDFERDILSIDDVKKLVITKIDDGCVGDFYKSKDKPVISAFSFSDLL